MPRTRLAASVGSGKVGRLSCEAGPCRWAAMPF
jgi:hypothetical protein